VSNFSNTELKLDNGKDILLNFSHSCLLYAEILKTLCSSNIRVVNYRNKDTEHQSFHMRHTHTHTHILIPGKWLLLKKIYFNVVFYIKN
jgi:hypothetical protein